MSLIKPRIVQLLAAMNKDLFEKEEAISLAVLSAIAGESIFLLGSPGVAKSVIARRLKCIFPDAKSFEYLMNRFSTPDEIFGPVSIQKLKDQDTYERNCTNYLPGATVAFLDEIWKASPSIQNALLTILNEKIYRNGDKEIQVPLKGIIAASNELPAKDQGLEALWDRFLIRYEVRNIQHKNNFRKILTGGLNTKVDNLSKELLISDAEYTEWAAKIEEIVMPEEVMKVIDMIVIKVSEYNGKNTENPLYVSDRRWKKVSHLLRTSAFLNDRKEVDLMDCFLIGHCIWDNVAQIEAVKQMVSSVIKEYGYAMTLDIKELKKEIKDFTIEVSAETKKVKEYYVEEKEEVKKGYYELVGLKRNASYNLIKVTDYDSLTVNERQIYLYDIHQNTTNVRISNENDTLSVRDSYYYEYSTCTIKTKKVHKKDETTLKPNERLKKEWNLEVVKLIAHIKTETQKIEDYRKAQAEHLQNNQFVDKQFAQIVESNLHASIQELQEMKLNVEKIKHYYDSLK